MHGYQVTKQRWKVLCDHLHRTFTATVCLLTCNNFLQDKDHNGVIDFDEFVKAVEDPDSPLGMLFMTSYTPPHRKMSMSSPSNKYMQ